MEKKQTYKYVKQKSILYNVSSDYCLSQNEYYKLYSFYVTYSLCEGLSWQKKNLEFYGWNKKKQEGFSKDIKSIIDFKQQSIIFTEENDLGIRFSEQQLLDCPINYETERGVIGITTGKNEFHKFIRHIRNIFAHGGFALKYNSSKEKMIIMQDHDQYNVTARIVLKLSRLLQIIDFIDKKNIFSEEK